MVREVLYKRGKLDNLILFQEMERLDISNLGIAEMRLTDSGSFYKAGQKVVYSCGERHEKGAPFIYMEIFYQEIENAYARCKPHEVR